MASSDQKAIKFIDLFAGIGGFHLAFQDYARCVFASEKDRYARITYQSNLAILSQYFNDDITNIAPADIPDHDILCGGFPCQAFSISGQQDGLSDPRGQLIFNVFDILRAKRPQAFLLENVKNLLHHNFGLTYQFIKNELIKCGYFVTEKILNTCEYGNVPQNRERVYIVGFRDEALFNAFRYPQPVKLTVSIQDLLDDEVLERHYFNHHKFLMENVPMDGLIYQYRRSRELRANKKGLCPTLTASCGTGGFNAPIIRTPAGVRRLTPAECLRFQGFPPSFRFPVAVSMMQQYRQVGNTVSVPVVRAIAAQMIEAMNNPVRSVGRSIQGVQLSLI